jgi:hypothetical protein
MAFAEDLREKRLIHELPIVAKLILLVLPLQGLLQIAQSTSRSPASFRRNGLNDTPHMPMKSVLFSTRETHLWRANFTRFFSDVKVDPGHAHRVAGGVPLDAPLEVMAGRLMMMNR